MKINHYLDSTYLKTPKQAGISDKATVEKVKQLTTEAIKEQFKLVMIRPSYVPLVKKIINKHKSNVLVGTVIGFYRGDFPVKEKLQEAQKAIDNGADELDFVINYKAFLNGKINLVKEEVLKGTKLVLEYKKTIKWIIEVAALTNQQIIDICKLIRAVIIENFDKEKCKFVYVKSSTGFYQTDNNKPNGATLKAMQLIIKHSYPLPTKAAGGIKSYNDAIKMINLGVLRIGSSSAKQIADGGKTKNSY